MEHRQEFESYDDEESPNSKHGQSTAFEDSDFIEEGFVDEKLHGGDSSFSGTRKTKVVAALIVSLVLAATSAAIGVSLQQRQSSSQQGRESNGGGAADGNGTIDAGKSSTPTISPHPAATAPPSPTPSESPASRDPSYGRPSSAPTACVPDYNGSSPEPLPGKRGAAFALTQGASDSNLPKLLALKPYWFYSWSPSVPDAVRQATAGIEFLPMVWGAYSMGDHDSTLAELATDARIKRLLGFNEPDKSSQANLNVSDAVTYWERIESIMPQNVSLVSPACSDPDGEWMQEFMSNTARSALSRQQGRCGVGNSASQTIDYVAVHWYGSPDVETFQSAMQMYYSLYNRTLMITEFAVADWMAETVQDNRYSREGVLEFMKAALPWLEAQSWIAAYSWFPYEITDPVGTSSSLFDRNGNLTRLGSYYKSVTNENPAGNQSISVWKI